MELQENVQKTKKKINTKQWKWLHIAVIVLGIIFISIPIFHSSLWFDESYSVGMASRSFADIWNIGSNDVHPVLYYCFLHILNLIFGSNIIIYRLFSMVAIAVLGIIGYTHIRKDFGEKTGFLFSFFAFFLPTNLVYAGEIRMYTWAMLFVTLMAIYAYRIYKNGSMKDWVLFTTFSLASAYTHYYGLVTACIMNAILFIYLLVKAIQAHKKDTANKVYTSSLKRFTVGAIVQIVVYLPWFVFLLNQIGGVSKGFWIQRPSLKLFSQIFTFQFTGNLDVLYVPNIVALVFGGIILSYAIYCIVQAIRHQKSKKENLPGFWAIGTYLIVVVLLWAVSLKTPILYARYFLNITGLFIFFMAFFMAKEKRNYITAVICAIVMAVSIFINVDMTKANYDWTNKEPVNYIQKDLQEGDMILFGNEGSGFALSMQLPSMKKCFYDAGHWNVEPAYRAFDPEMQTIKTLEPLDDYEGRIWIINSDSFTIYQEFAQRYGTKVNLIKQGKYSTPYHTYQYTVTLIEKVK